METVPYLRPAVAIVLAEARNAARLSQQKLADFVGLSKSYITALEAGEVGFSGESLYALLAVLHVDVVSFFQRVEAVRARKPELTTPGRGKKRSYRLTA